MGLSHEVLMSPSPWENEKKNYSPQFLTPGTALTKLEFNHPDIHPELLDSIIASEWVSFDNGRIYLEIRNKDYMHKIGNPIYISDFDDCIMSTTEWHKSEYNLLSESPELRARQVNIAPDKAKKVYEMSKILIPGKVMYEKRYTPRLNLVLLTDIVRSLEMVGADSEVVWSKIDQVRDAIVDRVAKLGEEELGRMRIDGDILHLFKGNSPERYLQTKFVDDLYENKSDEFQVIMTRGKPEGLLGQIYKVHTSGVLSKSVDFVLYTNDIKAEAFVLLSCLIPWMKTEPITLYDDNPNEVLPYIRFIRDNSINNIEVVHVRHPNAKRKDIEVNDIESPIGVMDSCGTKYDHYHPKIN